VSSVALAVLLDLLTDDQRFLEAERVVRRLVPNLPEIDDDTLRYADVVCVAGTERGLVLARQWFAGLITAGVDGDDSTILSGARPFVAYLAAALAARVARLPEAKRWLRVGRVEAEADALGAEEVALFIEAIRFARR